MERVEGMTAFITGGARGIGLGIGRAFARAGVKLAIADIDPDSLAAAKAELARLAAVETFNLDVRNRDAYAFWKKAIWVEVAQQAEVAGMRSAACYDADACEPRAAGSSQRPIRLIKALAELAPKGFEDAGIVEVVEDHGRET